MPVVFNGFDFDVFLGLLKIIGRCCLRLVAREGQNAERGVCRDRIQWDGHPVQ